MSGTCSTHGTLKKFTHKVLVGKSEGKKAIGRNSIGGCGKCLSGLDMNQVRALNTVMKFRCKRVQSFFAS